VPKILSLPQTESPITMLLSVPLPTRRMLVLAVSAALLSGVLPAVAPAPARAATSVFINEIHYDNVDADAQELVEVAGPAGTVLDGWSLVLYNGNGGASYGTVPLLGLLDDQQGGFGTASFDVAGLQNGAPDGVALVDGADAVIQFLSYEGTLTAVGGPADGMTSTDIGVDEDPAPALGESLQLTGNGTAYEEFTWTGPIPFTPGAPNTGQTFGLVENQPVVATCGPALSTAEGFAATRQVSATDADGTVTSLVIDSITPEPGPGEITIGATTPADGVGGTATATVTVGPSTPLGTYEVTVLASNDDETPQTGACTLTVSVQPIRTIGEVQGQTTDTENGLTDVSPFVGQQVFVRGVVTQRGRFPTSDGGQNFGFWIQSTSADTDDDALSSDGVFVFIGSFTTVLRLGGGPAYQPAVGDQIVLRANVVEFFNLTELSSPRLVEVETSGIDIGADLVTTEAAPPDLLADANRFWERHEGMRFHVDANSKVVAARDVFASTQDAEMWVIRGDHPIALRAEPYERLVYRDPHPLDDDPELFDNGNGMRIMLQSHGLKWLASSSATLIAPANTYDTVTNELTGALYFAFGKYGIEVEQQPALSAGADAAQNAPPSPAVDGVEFASSDYNVENLYDFRDDPFDGCDFSGDTGCPGVDPPFDYVPASGEAYQKHLTDLADQIAGPMHAPDLLMIQEAEDQDVCWVSAGELACDLSGEPETNNADGRPDTLQELALAITDAGGPTYQAAYDRDGADDRGIVSAFMYRTDAVELLPNDASDPVLGSSPTIDYRGDPLAYNADVSNPKVLNADLPADVDLSTGSDGTNVYTRPPLVGHFRVWRDGIGASVFTDLYAISNHFSSTPNRRVGQRTEQAAYNAAIVAALEADGVERVISGGDFNVFPRPDDPFAPGQPYGDDDFGPSDQLGPMYAAELHNLWETLVTEVPQSAYSYSFEGQAQTLDMQWATAAQFDDLVQVRAGHFNADFAADFDDDVARAASDHDPQLARWFTDVTIDRLHALVDHYVATGDLPADKAFLFHDRLERAAAFLAQGMRAAYEAQLMAFGNQAHDYATPFAADALEREADRLATLP
jgi:predicted extracellular nuclease